MAFNFGYKMNPEREPLLLPGVPTNLTVEKATDIAVTLLWDAPIGGDVEPTNYEYYKDGFIAETRGNLTITVSATPNVAVDYKVRSVSAEGGRSAWTDVVTYTNVVLQTGVDTTTGQVDIAFTDATNVVYWDGLQYLQTEVTDTPIDTWIPVVITVDDFCTKHEDEVSVYTWNPTGNTPADSFDYVVTTVGTYNTRPIMRAGQDTPGVPTADYKFTFNATWATDGLNVQPILFQVSVGENVVISYPILQGANEVIWTNPTGSETWFYYYPASNKIFDLQMRDMLLFRSA